MCWFCRLAALSEGWLDNGQLQCRYHGWGFDGSGQCTHCPQASPELEERITSTPRGNLQTFPTLVHPRAADSGRPLSIFVPPLQHACSDAHYIMVGIRRCRPDLVSSLQPARLTGLSPYLELEFRSLLAQPARSGCRMPHSSACRHTPEQHWPNMTSGDASDA